LGRAAESWQDFDFFGHQLSAHVAPSSVITAGRVDAATVPIPHFGVVLDLVAWRALADRLVDRGIAFRSAPELRFKGQRGEQGSFFVDDPSGNVLEFKGFADHSAIFASVAIAEDSEIRLKRLRMRAWRRGMREMDLILGPFADSHLTGIDALQLDAFEALLSENDQDLYQWCNGSRESPQQHSEIIGRIRFIYGFP
jgi:extradiol dioxygenase family protein/succinate dehydrogenase flavin-adding protein (antitoxin of CptAB toxin-antitoxin module)